MPRASAALTVAQFDLLTWVEQGCPDGVYEDTSHRVSARALHNRGLLKVAGRAGTWTASLTPAGTERLKDERTRIEAQRERERREVEAAAERERARQRQHEQATKVLDRLLQAGGRIDLGAEFTERDLKGFAQLLADTVPDQQRLAHEPTRMDPDLGWTAYLEPDFPARIRPRPVQVPKQLRGPHAVVTAFLDKRASVSKAQIPRASRLLQGLVSAVTEIGWKVDAKPPSSQHTRHGNIQPDLTLRLPSREVAVMVGEIDLTCPVVLGQWIH